MHRVLTTCAALAAVAASHAPVWASSAGGSIYVPAPIKPRPQHAVRQASCETPGCLPGSGCAPVGFAGVDPSTPPPCTAEGGCYPRRGTFGFTHTQWRRWPGGMVGSPSPQIADPDEDSLLPAFDPPEPEEEDQQAPASIEDSAEADAEADGADVPDREITLPPMPEGGIEPPRPASPFGDGPPDLPFGWAPRGNRDAVASRPTTSRTPTGSSPVIWSRSPETPATTPQPATDDRPTATLDGPPPLPTDFTSLPPRAGVRRLPTVVPPVATPRFDGAVRPVVAITPADAR